MHVYARANAPCLLCPFRCLILPPLFLQTHNVNPKCKMSPSLALRQQLTASETRSMFGLLTDGRQIKFCYLDQDEGGQNAPPHHHHHHQNSDTDCAQRETKGLLSGYCSEHWTKNEWCLVETRGLMYTVIAAPDNCTIKQRVDSLAGVSGRAGGSTSLSRGQRGCIGAFAGFARFVSLHACEAARRLMEPISWAIQQSGHTLPACFLLLFPALPLRFLLYLSPSI